MPDRAAFTLEPVREGSFASAGFASDYLEAGASGLFRHPIVGPALSWAGRQLGYSSGQLDLLKEGVGVDTTPEKAIQFIAQYGPDLVAGLGSYLAGGRVAVAGLRAAAARYGATEGGQLASVLARAARDQGLKQLAGQAHRPPAELARLLGHEMRQPLIERLAQLGGGNVAFGAYEGVRALAEGQSPADAAKAAALYGTLGAGVELGLLGVGRGLVGRGKFLSPERIEARGAPQVETIRSARHEAEAQLEQLAVRIDEALETQQSIRAIESARELNRREALALGRARRTELNLRKKYNVAETRATALAQVEEAEGSFVYTSDRPVVNRGPIGVIRDLGIRLALTPEGMSGKFGATGARVMAALQQANEQATILHTVSYEKIGRLRQEVFHLLGYGETAREPVTSGLLMRIQHEWERIGGGKEAVASFLRTLPDEHTSGVAAARVLGSTADEPINMTTRNIRWRDHVKRSLSEAEALRVGEIFDDIAGHLRVGVNQVYKVGGLPPLTPRQLRKLGVRAHLTHLGEAGLDDRAMFERLQRLYGDEEASRLLQLVQQEGLLPSQREAQMIDQTRRGVVKGFYNRIGRFATFDHTRAIRGTAWEKSLAGIPIQSDPFQAAIAASRHAAFRYEMAQVVGPRGELVEFYRDMVKAEALLANRELGATAGQRLQARMGRQAAQVAEVEAEANASSTAQLFSDIVNEVLDNRYYDESLMRMARTLTSWQVASKMAMGVVSNFTQPQNNAFMFGTVRALKGWAAAIRQKDPLTGLSTRRGTPLGDELALALALPHTIFRGMSGALDAGLLTQRSERMAEALLKYTGFSGIEVLNRMSAGATARLTFRDLVIRASQGRLRGVQLDNAHRVMADLGVSLTREATQLAEVGATRYFADPRVLELTQRVAFAGAQKTQFIPSRFRKPVYWNTPIGRVMFQFKTFALHQSRLLRDTVLAEFAQGNVRPFATALAVVPLSGEFIATVKDFVRDNRDTPSNHVLRAVSNVLYMGGFGLAGDLYQSIIFGDLASMVGGPTVDSAWELMRSAARLDPSIGARHLAKLPTVSTAVKLIDAAAQVTDELAEEWGQRYGSGLVVEDLDALRFEDAQSKTPFGPTSSPLVDAP